MTAAEALGELRELARVFRSARDGVRLRQVVETAAEVATYGVDPVIELRLQVLRRLAGMRDADL